MEQLYKPKKSYLDSDVLCPIKMEIVREKLQRELLIPNYSDWDKESELKLMQDLSLRTLPKQYIDIQMMARKLYSGYLFARLYKVEGIKKWEKEFNEVLYEEDIDKPVYNLSNEDLHS